MGILTNESTPTPSSPIVGTGTQQMFFNSLYNMGLTPTGGTQNGVPGSQFAGMPAYQGQMTPDLSQMLSSRMWGQWGQGSVPGFDQAGALGSNAQFNINPGFGWNTGQMSSGSTSGNPLSFLSGYMGNGNQVAMPQPNYNFNQPPPGHSPYGSMMMGGSMGGGGLGLHSNMVPGGGMDGGPTPGFGGEQGRGMTPFSTGGQQNVPNVFGGGTPTGFGGFNAGMANGTGSPIGYGTGGNNNYSMQAMSPNQGLGQLPGQMGYLQNIAAGLGGTAGGAINQLPAWNSMIQAQNDNIQTGADSLAEQFNNGGGLFSTAYGSAQGKYQEQARLGQNAMLTGAVTQAQQQANQNQLSAAGQLSGQGYGALGQLSNQGFGANQTAAQLGTQATLAGLQNNQAMYGLGLQGAGLQNSMYNSNQQMGLNLGNQQLLANQNGLNAQYQNWFQSQPQNNPLLSMMYAGATGYPQMQQTTYSPGWLGGLLGAAGGILGGIGSIGAGFSDRRLKENIKRIGKIGDNPVYSFNFKGLPKKQIGFMAQDVYKRHPEAVIKGDDSHPWMINYTVLAKTLGVAA